jgi:hypothetical protein
MLNPRVTQPPKELFDDTPEGEKARKEFGDNYPEMMKREWYSIGSHLGYMYENSPIIVPDGPPQPPKLIHGAAPERTKKRELRKQQNPCGRQGST